MIDDGDRSGESPGTDRDGRGHFRPGNGVSRNRDPARKGGRPPRSTEQAYLDAILGEVPLDRWKEIVRTAAKDAAAGDPKARDFLAKYLCPPESRTRVAVETATSDRQAAIEAALSEYAALLAPDAETEAR